MKVATELTSSFKTEKLFNVLIYPAEISDSKHYCQG